MFSGLLAVLSLPWLIRQWQRYSTHEGQQAAMLPFADDPELARQIELETGLPCRPERLAQQTTLLG